MKLITAQDAVNKNKAPNNIFEFLFENIPLELTFCVW